MQYGYASSCACARGSCHHRDISTLVLLIIIAFWQVIDPSAITCSQSAVKRQCNNSPQYKQLNPSAITELGTSVIALWLFERDDAV